MGDVQEKGSLMKRRVSSSFKQKLEYYKQQCLGNAQILIFNKKKKQSRHQKEN